MESSSSEKNNLTNEPLIADLITAKTSVAVADEIRKRTDSVVRSFALIFTAVGIIVTGGGTLIVTSMLEPIVTSMLEPIVEKKLDEAVNSGKINDYVKNIIDNSGETIRFDIEVADLNLKAQDIKFSPSFSSYDADVIISKIFSLISKTDRDSDKLKYAVTNAVENFALVGRFDLVIKLDENSTISNLLRKDTNTIISMVQMSGFYLLGHEQPPSSWKDRDVYKIYQTYAKIANDMGYPELYLLYKMLLGYIDKQPMDAIEDTIDKANSLGKVNSDKFVELIKQLATDKLAKSTTDESKRAADRVAKFLCEYGDDNGILYRAASLVESDRGACAASGT